MAKAPSKPTTKSTKKAKPAPKAAKTPIQNSAPSAKSVAPARKTSAPAKLTSNKISSKTSKPSLASKPSAKPAAKTSSLQAKLDDVAKRLISAETQTKNNIAALETDFSALAKQMGRTKAGQTRLTRRVTELSKTLTQDLASMQTDIRRELAGVLQNPTLESLQAALSRAESRLEESENAQGAAIARINHHIADIATIVEERLSNEARTREEAMAEMKRAMNAGQSQILAAQAALEKTQTTQSQAMQLRFSNMQSESADAIRSLGDKLVDVAEEMGNRRNKLAIKLRQELSEATLSANAEFEQFRRIVERRLEALESDMNGFDTQIDRAIAPLTSRVEGLEYGLTQAPAAYHDYAPSLQSAPPMTAVSPLSAPVNQAAPVGASAATSHAAALQHYEEDAFSPSPAPVYQAAAPHIQEEPLDLTQPAPAKAVPYNPSAYQTAAAPAKQSANPYGAVADSYAQNSYAQAPKAELQQSPYGQAALEGPAYTSEQAAPQHRDASGGYSTAQPPFPYAQDLALHDADLPYADPAYAEAHYSNPNLVATEPNDDSMGAARPGAFDNLKKIGRKSKDKAKTDSSGLSGLMTPRNLRLGGLVAALGLASFIGVQSLIPKDAPLNNGEFSVANNAALDESRPSLAQIEGQILQPNADGQPTLLTEDGAPQINQETIGQYADNQKMALAAGGVGALSEAANAGNPVAQLQLGLSQIESGQIESGVALIRAAANQEQPAALYRLAKLYETGQGVGKDAQTARQLTERAARGGNRIAMHDLALYFAEGRGGVDIDMPTAAKWFEKAAERGVVDSQFNLGVLFESGQGLPQDMESALMWYSVAGAQGDQMAAGRVGVLRKTLTDEQVDRADKRIAAFIPSRIDEQANGIFTNVPWAQASKVASTGASKAGIVQTQTLLNELGYAVGTADGAIGPKTKNAILNFQRNNGLSETGTVNAELIEKLEVAAGA